MRQDEFVYFVGMMAQERRMFCDGRVAPQEMLSRIYVHQDTRVPRLLNIFCCSIMGSYFRWGGLMVLVDDYKVPSKQLGLTFYPHL